MESENKISILGRNDLVPLKDANARTRRYVEAGKRKIVYRSIDRDFANSSMFVFRISTLTERE
jgi:hypothetical protein